jgi:hypothetical protein
MSPQSGAPVTAVRTRQYTPVSVPDPVTELITTGGSMLAAVGSFATLIYGAVSIALTACPAKPEAIARAVSIVVVANFIFLL